MIKDIAFKAEDGTELHGWHNVPDKGKAPFATVIMARGFSAVKEMYLDKFAEVFADAGIGSLVFDNRSTRIIPAILPRISYLQLRILFGSLSPALQSDWNMSGAD
jgi:hypothetical protein